MVKQKIISITGVSAVIGTNLKIYVKYVFKIQSLIV